MWRLQVQNIAGIKSGTATFEEGTNVIQASNFQGKSSLLKAIQTVMGTTGVDGSHPLTEGQDEGFAELETDDGTYRVELKREGGTVVRSGDPYLTDETDVTCAHHFAFLGENNPVRAAVRDPTPEGDKRLTELLMEPLDVDKIDAKIAQLQSERNSIESEIDEAERANKKLPKAQEEVTRLEKELEEARERKDELEDQVDEDSEQKELSSKLSDKRSRLNNTRNTIQKLESRIDRKKSNLEDKQDELDELEIPSEPKINTDINEKEERIDELDLQIDLLRRVHSANKQVLDEDAVELVTDVEHGIEGDQIVCWLSGDKTTADEIEERLDRLNERRLELREEKSDLEQEVDEIESKKRTIRSKKRKRDNLEDQIGNLKLEIQEDEQELKQARERVEDLQVDIDELESQYEETQDDLNSELTEVRTEIGSLKTKLENAREKLERLDETAGKTDDLEDELETIKEEIVDLRERRNQRHEEVVDRFETAMKNMLEQFDPGFEMLRLDRSVTEDGSTKAFELVVLREGRETSVENLSEGEVELIGFVTALAAHQAFEVDEIVPAILVDGVGQLAAEHIKGLTEFLEGASEMLITTAYPEAGDFGGHTLTPDEWDVVSDEEMRVV
jgi:chromosome segregation ATPase